MAEDHREKPEPGDDPAINGVPHAADKAQLDREKLQPQPDDQDRKKHDGPEGGFANTPIPSPRPGVVGYTLKFTMLQATNLAMGDAHALSSDPYILAQLNTELPMRHKEDPKLRFRTPTVRKSTEPEWNEAWIVANVPSTGFKLKLRVYDEDPADHDDMLGKVHVTVPHIDDSWKGFQNQRYELTIRDSSKRALFIRAVANCLQRNKHLHGDVFLSIENLGRTGEDGQNGRVYTVGPCRWVRHYSPLLGRIANIKEPGQHDQAPVSETSSEANKKNVERYNFQANQMQFPGPIPAELYHRFVEFKPWVKRMFDMSGFSGVVLGKALHHQHARVYNFDRSTIWGHFEQGPCKEMTQQFLDLVHYDKAGRIFTYVLTLDALFRFTETGKEFGIDLLSKHTMHSDVAIYIAFSGEFFIRKIKPRQRLQLQSASKSGSQQDSDARPVETANLEEPAAEDSDESTDPSNYELVIDNDSGTYRPNAALLPTLAAYLSHCLPGLHVKTLDCQADADEQQRLKAQQRERKQKEGNNVVYTQGSDSSSISSSDEEELDGIQAAYQQDGTHETHNKSHDEGPVVGASKKKGSSKERSALQTAAKDVKMRQEGKMEKYGRNIGLSDRDDAQPSGGLMEKHHSADGTSS